MPLGACVGRLFRESYRAAPVFAAPPCPVELGADCVVLGAVAVDDVGLQFLYAIPAMISTMTTKAPMPHKPRRELDGRRGSAPRSSSTVTGRAGSVYVRRAGSVGS